MMKSTKPYLLEAMYRWIIDSDCRPLIMSRTDILGVVIPQGYATDNEVVLDVSAEAVRDLKITENLVSFEASFEGHSVSIRLPMPAVLAIHAAENGLGIEFDADEYKPEDLTESLAKETDEGEGEETESGSSDKKPNLRVL